MKTKQPIDDLFAPRKLKLPRHVVGIRTRDEFDSEGDPALGVWVILSDTSTEDQRHPKELAKITSKIRSVAEEHAEIPPPFVRFRLKSEQDQLDEARA
ncbi:MAG: hypothetical protein H6752_00900 [Candidatus Omnitrophica bacterium]|nr:hypothetical protein [Candidatus Omnitrophota bacterium]